MHIAIDCRLGGIAHAGIGRYITHLVQELIAVAPAGTRWSILCGSQQQATEVLGKHRNKKNVQVVIVPVRHYTIREQLYLLPVLLKLRPDILHVPHFNAPVGYWGKTVVTIHDLLWHEMRGSAVTTLPAWQYWFKYYFYTLVTKRSVTHSAAILVPSKSVEKTIVNFYPTVAPKISVTTEGVSGSFLLKREPEYNWTKRQKNGVLYVGSLYPHKNVQLILHAMQELPGLQLTVVGTRSAFMRTLTQTATELRVLERVTFSGPVSDTALAKLYANCAALVQPSKSEGFGLTGIEAMASGAPVLCSNIPVFREVYGEHAQYFDPYSVQSFVAAYTQLADTKTTKIVARAYEYSKTFQWAKTAKATFAIYQKAAKNQV